MFLKKKETKSEAEMCSHSLRLREEDDWYYQIWFFNILPME